MFRRVLIWIIWFLSPIVIPSARNQVIFFVIDSLRPSLEVISFSLASSTGTLYLKTVRTLSSMFRDIQSCCPPSISECNYIPGPYLCVVLAEVLHLLLSRLRADSHRQNLRVNCVEDSIILGVLWSLISSSTRSVTSSLTRRMSLRCGFPDVTAVLVFIAVFWSPLPIRHVGGDVPYNTRHNFKRTPLWWMIP